ncbi:MAG: hypothetical protein EP335_04495 [Alphaproteobacteria bacterium]|nr:MAG: hypothetical protein EP335_04495 [Alphaproteobacteria bacterium]
MAHTKLDVIDVLEKALARHLEWIRAADTKLSLLLPVETAMFGAIAIKIPETINKVSWCQWLIIGFSVALLLSSLACTALSFFPRTDGPSGRSYIYFGIVASGTFSEFKQDVEEISRESYEEDLVKQCYANASIAKVKFALMRRSTFLTITAFPFWVIALFLLY